MIETLKLENHEERLNRIKFVFDKLHRKYLHAKKFDELTELKKKILVTSLENLLTCLSILSQTRFDVRDKIEDYYLSNFKKHIGRKIFNDEYINIHKPYDILKDDIWDLIFKINEVKNN